MDVLKGVFIPRCQHKWKIDWLWWNSVGSPDMLIYTKNRHQKVYEFKFQENFSIMFWQLYLSSAQNTNMWKVRNWYTKCASVLLPIRQFCVILPFVSVRDSNCERMKEEMRFWLLISVVCNAIAKKLSHLSQPGFFVIPGGRKCAWYVLSYNCNLC